MVKMTYIFWGQLIVSLKVKMIVTNEEGAFLMLQKAKKLGEKSTKSTRKMVGKNEMIYTMEVVGEPDTLCVQKFKRIA